MPFNLGEILAAVQTVKDLEAKVEALVGRIKEAIENEKDKKRRKKILAAVDRRDLDALRDLLFS
jgi:predicted transcriptional regulator